MIQQSARGVLLACAIWLSPACIHAAGIGFTVGITNSAGINSGAYASGPGFVNIAPGLVVTLPDPSAVFTSTPSVMPLGLTGADMLLTTGSDNSLAHVFGSLASGAIHTQATAGAGGSIAVAEGTLDETLTFHVAGGGQATVGYSLALDGTFSGGWYSNSVNLALSSASFGWVAFDNGPVGFGPTNQTTGWDRYTLSNDSLTGFNFRGVTTVTDGEQVRFTLTQQLDCRFGTACDFGNTLQSGLELPPGVQFTSESGEFLSAATPEPVAALPVLCGFLAMAFMRRRKQRV